MKKKYNIKILPDMNNGDYFIKSLENDNVAIVKFKSGYKVFSLTCPHMGGNIVVRKSSKNLDEENEGFPIFQCNWHGYIYNIDGSFKENPNIENTKNVRVKSKYYNPVDCEKNLKKNLMLNSIKYIIKEDTIEIEI